MIASMSTLYIVATPIGNLGDITLRALEILKTIDLILCEDTRVTKKLLARYDIHTKTLSYHTHSGLSKTEKIIGLLKEGKNLALVSDAGTPGISDPGAFLISKIKDCLGDEITFIPIPGASALTAALSASGILSDNFLFLGFLPRKKGRQTIFSEIKNSKRTIVFYESPHRILKTLRSLADILSPDRNIFIARELTKVFEETKQGTAGEIYSFFINNPSNVRGEFVVVISGSV